MPALPTYNHFPGQTEALEQLDWREEEMGDKLNELQGHHAAFDHVLTRDVTSQDLFISGGAIADVINRSGPTWYVGAPPAAEVGISYRATDDESKVHLYKTRNDNVTRASASLLARQVLGKGLWVPIVDVESRRTAKITGLVAEVSATTVEISAAGSENVEEANDASSTTQYLYLSANAVAPLNADEIVSTASWMAHAAYGSRYIQEHSDMYPPIVTSRSGGSLLDDPNLLARAWAMTVDSMREQANANPTAEEYASEAQDAIDRWFAELDGRISIAGVARRVVNTGRRIRTAR